MLISKPNFERSFLFVLSLEKGYWPGNQPSDPNPTLDGVTERAYDSFRKHHDLAIRPVLKMTDIERLEIYHGYWLGCSADNLEWPVALIHFDTAFNSGKANAIKLGVRAGYDPVKYLAVRQKYYDDIVRDHPAMLPNKKGWKNRLAKIKAFIDRNP